MFNRLFRKQAPDPYWDAFINRPLSDPANILSGVLRDTKGAVLHPVQTDIHDSGAMSGHLKTLARFFGAQLVAIAATDPALVRVRPGHYLQDEGDEEPPPEQLAARLPFAIICARRSDHDPAIALGYGGQYPVQRLAEVHFNLRGYLRELGYHAVLGAGSVAALAAAAGMGRLDGAGRLVAPSGRQRVVLGDVVLTDIPLVPDNPASGNG